MYFFKYNPEIITFDNILDFIQNIAIDSYRVKKTYQEAFLTPGISPLYANSRKQIRQMPYFLSTLCGLPQILHLV